MSDIYQGRCIDGPCDGEWLVVGRNHFDTHGDAEWGDGETPEKLGTYHWSQGQWLWRPVI